MTVIEPGTTSSDLVGRAKRLLLSPSSEWDRIDVEPATIKGLYVGYVCILAAIPPLAGLIGGLVFGYGGFGYHYRPAIGPAVLSAVVTYGMSLLSVFLVALIIDALAPSFDGQKSQIQAFKVAAYSYTASWVFGILGILPALGMIGALAGLYSLYLLYLGLPKLMKAPKEKALGYTVVTVLCAIVLSVIAGLVTTALIGPAMFGAGVYDSSRADKASGSLEVNGSKVDLDKLQAAAARMEANKDKPAVPAEALKALLPGATSGYARTSLETNSAGAEGMGFVTARGEYERDGKHFTLAVTDLGPMAGMAAMAGAMNAQSSTETDTGYKKAGQVNGRLTTEEWDRESKNGGYTVVVADRFSIEANGEADSIDVLKQAVASVDAGRLEGLAR